MVHRMAYPSWFSHHEEHVDDAEHQEFEEFRERLKSMVKHIYKIDKTLVFAFIEREIDLARFQKRELPFSDTPFENREEPAEHRFRSARGGAPVTIYARRR